MRFNLLVVSLCALGISSSTWAAEEISARDSFQRDVMREQMNKIDWILDKNQPGGFDQPCGWTCRINVSGWINVDAYLGNRPPVFLALNPETDIFAPVTLAAFPILLPTSGRASDLLLNNANLFVDARVNNWVTANTSFVYSSLTGIRGSQGAYAVPNSLFVYQPVSSGAITRAIDTAYATIGNLQVSPIYFRVGKEYVPFDRYQPYSFVTSENPTQLFTEINAPTAQLGFIINGFYGSLYTFAGNPKLSDGSSTRRIQNGGIDLGYGYNGYNNKFNINAGYIANITDSNFLSAYYTNPIIELSANLLSGLPNQKAPAYNVNAEVQFGPFDANGHYVATTRDFRKPVLLATPIVLPASIIPGLTFKKPKLWGVEVGVTFPVIAHQSRLALGYQRTTQLGGILPNQRFYVDYMLNLAKWFDLGIAVFQDRDFSLDEDQVVLGRVSRVTIAQSSGGKSTVGQLRASIKFA